MFNLHEFLPATYLLPQEGLMRVPGLIFTSKELLSEIQNDRALEQVMHVASLPGILGYSIAMPDIHWGYGFPIGGVAATDFQTGVISPGGVGYDINCGVRLALLDEPFASFSPKIRSQLLQEIFNRVPSGVGSGSKRSTPLSSSDYHSLVQRGASWSIDQGHGYPEDLLHMESQGCIANASLDPVSFTAQERGRSQLGSIGSGNHFVEIGSVETIFLPEIAHAWNLQQGQTYVLIHSGSRGFGHQICQDTLDLFLRKGFAEGLSDKQLVSTPLHSPEGQAYFAAMNAAANFAFNNRQQILTAVRQAFQATLSIIPKDLRLLYDVCHNIAKIEEHLIQGHPQKLCVHRKGATRALGPGAQELNPLFRRTGQPVLVPGDMGRASHIMVGLGNPLSFCSACHGAGRAKSRVKSLADWKGKDLFAYLRSEGVEVAAHSPKTIAEEMPDAYKDVDEVVNAVEQAKLAQKVARLRPSLVLKG